MIDSYVLRNCTPELKHYTGVEPDEHSFNELKSAIPASTDAKVSKRLYCVISIKSQSQTLKREFCRGKKKLVAIFQKLITFPNISQ